MPKAKPKLSAKEKKYEQALHLYETMNGNLTEMEKLPGMPTRQTLAKWRDEGLPVHITGGDNWDDYLFTKQKRLGIVPKNVDASKYSDEPFGSVDTVDVDDFDGMKRKAMEVFNRVVNHVLYGPAEIKLSDANTALKLYLFINGEQEKQIEFAEQFAEIVLGAAAKIMDEQQYARFNDLVADAVADVKSGGEHELDDSDPFGSSSEEGSAEE